MTLSSAWLDDAHSNPAHLSGGALDLQGHITMAGDTGYVIIPRAISRDQAQKTAEGIHEGLQPTETFNNRFSYPLTQLAREVIMDFTKNHIDKLQDFFAPTPVPRTPSGEGVGIFRSNQPYPKPRVSKNMVFVTIALTSLNTSTGWYTLLEGSEPAWKNVDKKLEPGDAIVWRGDVPVVESPGGGGKFINVTYNV
ncbi:MAG: hypothetical protein Q9217_000167 [Psora testacea]